MVSDPDTIYEPDEDEEWDEDEDWDEDWDEEEDEVLGPPPEDGFCCYQIRGRTVSKEEFERYCRNHGIDHPLPA